MKEFVEKLVGRLEEQKSDLTTWAEDKAFEIGIQTAISIVNQLAEEYNNGWISVDARLPKIDGYTSDTVLVYSIDGFQHMAFWCEDEKWRYCESGMIKEPMDWTVIIAWQPLPEPYQKGE